MEIVKHVVVSKAWRREDEVEEHDEVCMQCSINVRSGAPQRSICHACSGRQRSDCKVVVIH